jgi:hypothetical protein
MRKYRFGITYWLAALLVVFVTGCGQETINIPGVVSVTPAQGATGVLTNTTVTATFNMAMNPTSITTGTFTVAAPGGVAVTGAVSYSGLVATFTPAAVLAYSTTYTATITTGAATPGGAELVSNYVWTFSTVAAPPPPPAALAVLSTVPLNTATGVPIGQELSAIFNQAMSCPLASTAFTLVAAPGATSVTGTVGCSGSIATFSPASPLAYNTVYTATIAAGVTDLAGSTLALPYVWTFNTVPAPPLPPTVISTVPIDGAVGVPTNQILSATFSEAMDPATINSATFLVKATVSGTAVNGAINYVPAGSVATFAPFGGLAPSTEYTATITTGAMDLNDNAGVTAYTWTFTTAATPLTAAPTVISTIPVSPPLPEDVTVPLNQAVSAIFSEAMDPATIISANFSLTYVKAGVTTPVSGLVAYAAIGNELVFLPTTNLLPSTTYTATITTGVQNLTGNTMVNPYSWIFQTATAPVVVSPELVSTIPASAATGVPLNQAVSATFSEAMNPLTLNSATFLLYTGQTASGTPIAGGYSYDPISFIATFTPTNPLTASTFYTATVTDGATDLAGNPLGTTGAPNPWTFKTGAAAVPPPVVLGPTIAPFGGFGGGAGMTNQGIYTVVNGDIGTTGASTTMTGFHDTSLPIVGAVWPCTYTETTLNIGQVNGVIDTAAPPPTVNCPDEGTAATMAIATAAASEALTAYNTLQCKCFPGTGTAPAGSTLAGELGGLTLFPGTYTNASTVDITTGDLTLDAQGDTNAYWVFQVGSALTVGEAGFPRNVILAHGAQASHIFWAVATSATINGAGGGTFEGTIIAYSGGISVSTAGNAAITTIDGRLIALGASTTLVNTVINVPAP